jgi:hypothetical protein
MPPLCQETQQIGAADDPHQHVVPCHWHLPHMILRHHQGYLPYAVIPIHADGAFTHHIGGCVMARIIDDGHPANPMLYEQLRNVANGRIGGNSDDLSFHDMYCPHSVYYSY